MKSLMFLKSTFYEEYFLFVYFLVKAIPKKAPAVQRFVEKKHQQIKAILVFCFIRGKYSFSNF